MSSEQILPIITFVLGWFLNSLTPYFQEKRDNRRALGKAIADLLEIRNDLYTRRMVMDELKKELPPDLKMVSFYDQSLFVRSSARSVCDAILFGLVLSVLIIYFFLKNWGTTLTAIIVIPPAAVLIKQQVMVRTTPTNAPALMMPP